jgi:hypothetical protein
VSDKDFRAKVIEAAECMTWVLHKSDANGHFRSRYRIKAIAQADDFR